MKNANALAALPMAKGPDNLKVLPIIRKVQFDKLVVNTQEEVRFIPFGEILYCKSTQNYTTVFLKNGKSYLCSKTLKEIEAKLPASEFFRIHHSYVINLHSITAIKKKTQEVELNNQLLLPYSRSQRTGLYQIFNL
jgi:two-component system, LytTR family, response regulator